MSTPGYLEILFGQVGNHSTSARYCTNYCATNRSSGNNYQHKVVVHQYSNTHSERAPMSNQNYNYNKQGSNQRSSSDSWNYGK